MNDVDAGSVSEEARPGMRSLRTFWGLIFDALILASVCTLIALLTNSVRDDGLPLVAQKAYQILVPCPEVLGEATSIAAGDLDLSAKGCLVLDARAKADYDEWHIDSAWHVPYDFLTPVKPEVISKIASSGSKQVVVYGDGADPDTGEHLAKELSAAGIRNVGFISGGASALKKAMPARRRQ